ncbi:hypothetical protein NDU88_005594 [Pleurodeles waltl]|uniref:Uncharacterized protein n=1 Tax=Pleurodeles waltl TaxID=8319 RepID=A0AAV7TD15_PLEWA|nr:hypothetical protein NDU88_005594 [Pleurodeles waltl]
MPHLAPESDSVWRVLGSRMQSRVTGIDTVACMMSAVFRDRGVHGFLQDAGLTELWDWLVDGRLLDVDEAMAGCEGTALQRFYALRVRALVRDRLFGPAGTLSEFRALEVLCCARSPSKLV